VSPLGSLAAFAFGAVVAGCGFWLAVRFIDRNWWPWLDSMIGERTVKGILVGCAALAGAWIVVFVAFIVIRAHP
jgi:hypothetical protein